MGVVVFFCLLLIAGGVFFRSSVDTVIVKGDGFSGNKVIPNRIPNIDPQRPVVLHKDVDYSLGSKAKWYPKGESPILHALVKEGKLPPLNKRVPVEPVVIGGVDGVGKYGGSFVFSVESSTRLSGLMRMHFGGSKLVRWSPQGYPIVPNLAKKVDVSADNRIFRFYLRKGVRWSDGHPFTANDILYWWENEILETEYILGEMPVYMRSGGKPAKLVKIDDYTVDFVFEMPNALLLPQIASWGEQMSASPAHYLRRYHPRLGDQELIKTIQLKLRLLQPSAVYAYMKGIQGSLVNVSMPSLYPYTYNTHRMSSPYVLVRNPYYWKVDEEGNQLPYIDRVLLIESNKQNSGVMLTSGQLSFSETNYKNIPLLETNKEKGDYSIYYAMDFASSPFLINPNLNRRTKTSEEVKKGELLATLDFRKALSVSIDRQAIVDAEFLGTVEPAQCSPQRGSLFFDSLSQKRYTEYDTAAANRLLDGIGLTKRDREGYRTFKDGSRMTFYLESPADKGMGPSQFLVDNWRDVGLRVIPRERLNRLWMLDMKGYLHDLNFYHSEGEFIPYLLPASLFPYNHWESNFALGYAVWYVRGGLWGDTAAKRPGNIEPPVGSPSREAMEIFERIKTIGDPLEQRREVGKIIKLASENLFTIGLTTAPPIPLMISNNLKNVPNNALYGWAMKSPDNMGFDVFYLNKSDVTPEIAEQIKDEIITKKADNEDVRKIHENYVKMGKIAVDSEQDSLLLLSQNDTKQSSVISDNGKNSKAKAFFSFLVIISIVTLFLVLVSRRYPYVGKRLLLMIPTLLIISALAFFIIQLPPGDFITSYIAQLEGAGYANAQEVIAQKRETFNLDKSPIEQYVLWMGFKWFKTFEEKDKGVLQGNLGRSMQTEEQVTKMWGDRLLLTFVLSLCSILLVWSLAIPAGVFSAVKQYSLGDYAISLVGFIGMSIPSFLLAIVMMFLSFKYFDTSVVGLFSPEYGAQSYWTFGKFIDMLKHIWLPVVLVAISGTAGMIRVMRANLLDELNKPYVVTAMAKGVHPVKMLFKYPFRMAINPFISGIGGVIPALISGGGLVAIVLGLPTLDPLMLNALLAEDMYMAGSILMVLTTLGLVGVLISDLLLLWVDPRIRYESGTR